MTETLFDPARPLRSLTPTMNFAPTLLLRAQAVKVVFFDVDGVLTDGGLYFSEYPTDHALARSGLIDKKDSAFRPSGEIVKRFNTLDGHGLKLLQKAGITPAVITGRDSDVLRARLHALGVTQAHFGTEDKRPAAEMTLQALGLDWAAVAAMGDDWPDLPMMRRAAFSCAPSQAHAEVRAQADYITKARGGHGAVRELCDLLLIAGGHYDKLLQAYAQ